ncbi:MAG: hypothetical protein IJX17_04485 [Clostridia bacterium]|nr:hypothetical protein [Clostridia bacterium]
MAKKLGYMAKNIKLSFFGASLEGLDDFTLSDEIKVILAGPMLNFISVIGCYLSFWFYPESYNYLYDVLLSNLAILFFNLMPIYPLDLGRIMLALFSKNNLRVRALEKTKKISYVFIIFLFFIFLITFFINYNFIFGFICVNLMSLHLKSTNNTSYKRELFIFHKAKLLERGLIERKIYLKIGTPDYKLFKFIDDYHFINFVFLDNNYNVKTIISELDLYKKQSIM